MTLRTAAIGSVVALICGAASAAAQAASTSVALFSDPDSFVGFGVQRLFTPSNAVIRAEPKYGLFRVTVNPGRQNEYILEFAAPRGHALHRGVYDYAQEAEFRYGDHPGISIFGEGRACDETAGRFEVRDIARRRSGSIKRLWIVYEQHCGTGVPGVFGEVRLREPHRLALPSVVRWPEGEHGSVGTLAPVTFRPSSRTVRFGRARLAGANPHAFRISTNRCSGKTIQPGGSCRIWLEFRSGPGTHRAKLRVATASGRTYGATLEGFNWGGRTRLVMHSEKGDFIGQGLDWLFTPRNARLNRGGGRNHVTVDIRTPSDFWSGHFNAPAGDVLTASTYRDAVRWPSGDRPGLEVSGAGRGCDKISGKFTVTQVRYDPRAKAPRNFAARFVQHCEDAKPALRGELDFRAGDHTKPAPWMKAPGS